MKVAFNRVNQLTQKLTGSLFGRLFLISTVAAALMLVVMIFTLRDIQVHSPANQVSYQLLALNFSQTPPDPARLSQFSKISGWQLIADGPDFLWPETTSTELLAELRDKAGTTDFGFFWFGKQRWLVFRNQQYSYFTTTFNLQFSSEFRWILARGLSLLLVISVLSYLAIRWLFMPIKKLKIGADRIAGGDLDVRLLTPRKDELGAVNQSVNAMADRLSMAVEQKRQLLLAMGHELRTPLTRIKLLLEMLPQGEDRDQIVRNLDDINQLVVTLLDAEALSGGLMTLHKQATNIQQLLENCCSGYDQPIPLSIQAPLPEVQLDPVRMQIVLRNLLTNAFKYGDKQVDIKAEAKNNILQIHVSDDGQGIATEVLHLLGQPFYRPDSARTRKTGGHGLGLYLSRIIVESHGGRLLINSAVNKGTQVTIELPCQPHQPNL